MRLFRIRFDWIFLLASGCATIPVHELANSRDFGGCDQVVANAVDSGSVVVGDFPSEKWWEDFEDPTLTMLIEEALQSSPTLSKAEAKLKEAFQKAMEKRGNLFPEIDFYATDFWTHLSANGLLRGILPTLVPPIPGIPKSRFPTMLNDTIFGLTFSYEFDFWGKNRAIFNAALGQSAAAAAEKIQAELILTTSIAYTYAELQMLLQKRNLLVKMEINDQEIENIRTKRQKNALDSSIVQLDAVASTLDVKAQIIELEEQIETATHKLKALAGLGQDAELEITPRSLKADIFVVPENLSINLLARRPDLIAQKMRVEAAAKEIDAAKTQFYPNINIKAFVGLDSVFWKKLLSGDSYFGFLEPALHLPIFNAGKIQANLMEKAGEFNEAVYAYDELILQAGQDVADILATINRYTKETEVRETSLKVTQQQADLTMKRFKHALDNRMTVLQTQNRALQAQIVLLELEFGKQQAGINLIKSLGGGYHD